MCMAVVRGLPWRSVKLHEKRSGLVLKNAMIISDGPVGGEP